MKIRTLLRRIAARFAPEVCADCEGGSGTIFDSRLGTLKRCPTCNGTGLKTESTRELQSNVDRRTHRDSGRPRNVA